MNVIQMNGRAVRSMLESGKYKKVLLYFHHGLGDAIWFYNDVLSVLKSNYPDIEFTFDTHMGQEDYFGKPDKDQSYYDLIIPVVFPCSEWDAWSNETKAERCLRVEFGFDNMTQGEVYEKLPYGSPLVGLHLVSTSSASLYYDEQNTQKLWNAIKERGLIPIDTHFPHPDATIKRHAYPFENRNVDDIKPTVKTLFGLIKSLSGFAGVASGNFWVALSTMHPSTILYLENEFPVQKLTRLPVHHMKGYDERVVNQWLDAIEYTIDPKEV